MAESCMASKHARVTEPLADEARTRDLHRPAELVKLLDRINARVWEASWRAGPEVVVLQAELQQFLRNSREAGAGLAKQEGQRVTWSYKLPDGLCNAIGWCQPT